MSRQSILSPGPWLVLKSILSAGPGWTSKCIFSPRPGGASNLYRRQAPAEPQIDFVAKTRPDCRMYLATLLCRPPLHLQLPCYSNATSIFLVACAWPWLGLKSILSPSPGWASNLFCRLALAGPQIYSVAKPRLGLKSILSSGPGRTAVCIWRHFCAKKTY